MRLFALTLLIVFFSGLQAQEQLLFAPTSADSKVKKHSNETVKLPFFDDFSEYSGSPNILLWADNDAFVNNTLAIDPPTRGCATLDAVDATGAIHPRVVVGANVKADFLTTNPIDLSLPDVENVYLSFFYQPGGIGNMPEETDTLLVQFYHADEDKWNTIWYATGGDSATFSYVILPVSGAKYMKNDFRFRFVNYVSLPVSDDASTTGNADFWHIDYVYLNKDRSILDNVMHDIAVVDNLNSPLREFSAMPWKHYLSNPAAFMGDSIHFTYRNNDNTGRSINRRHLTVTDAILNDQINTVQGGAVNIATGNKQFLNFPVDFVFPDNGLDSARFMIEAKFETDDFDPIVNNAVRAQQVLRDFYAYDDGSSEASYGITGEGARNAMFAYRFVAQKEDRLAAVDMCFNQIIESQLIKPFYMTIWGSDGNGRPGFELYRKEGVKPQYDGIDNFIRYAIDSVVFVSDTFYVGWVQTTDNSLNLGYDLNTDASFRTFYNVSGEWKQSKIKGAAMMRPVMGELAAGMPHDYLQTQMSFYPNPANESIKLDLPDQIQISQLAVYSMQGICLQKYHTTQRTLDVSNLPNGIYLLVADMNGQRLAVKLQVVR